ncbi:hypothetical protein B597_017615 [Stutzerimonas stutzeri KOS6]|uniref:Uncharacterized protein n=1 Tax=Stutzerimonas stutzeri KOS6 TaxID=1218352 RepID=A0A061JMX6_STUST|nr:hypothetical protein B597_017615 [Stutzerimonas stutzeri KOS6]
MSFDNLLYNGQPYSGSWVGFTSMQALKWVEYFRQIFFIEADTVIGHTYRQPFRSRWLGVDTNAWCLQRVAKFECITEQVLEHLT